MKIINIKYLELVDMIRLKQVSKIFAGYKPLNDIIKLKKSAAFKGIRIEHWNKMSRISYYKVQKIEFLDKHLGKFLLIYGKYGSGKYKLGAFSTKERMLNIIHTLSKKYFKINKRERFKKHPNLLYISSRKKLLIVHGLNDYDIKMVMGKIWNY